MSTAAEILDLAIFEGALSNGRGLGQFVSR
jgi:hypothetical protein